MIFFPPDAADRGLTWEEVWVNLEQLRKQAKELARAARVGEPAAVARAGACERRGAADAVHARVSRRRGRRSQAAARAARRAPGGCAAARHERERSLRDGGRPRDDTAAPGTRRGREPRQRLRLDEAPS